MARVAVEKVMTVRIVLTAKPKTEPLSVLQHLAGLTTFSVDINEAVELYHALRKALIEEGYLDGEAQSG